MYCLRNQSRLEEKLGRAVLVKLFGLIRTGNITEGCLEKISYEQNMNVLTTFVRSRGSKEKIAMTLERMLDHWWEDTVCKLTDSEAQEELLRIVENTCPPVVAVTIKDTSDQFLQKE